MEQKQCPKCKGVLGVTDSMAPIYKPLVTQIFSESGAEVALWLVAVGCGVAFVISESVIPLIAGVIGIVAALRVHGSQRKQYTVYECGSCKNRFIGDELKPFSYATFKG